MTSEPKRLFDEDPGFAHLASASEKEGPSAAQMDKLLSLATQAAMTPRPRWSRRRQPSVVVGVAVIGASILGIAVGAVSFSRSGASRASEPSAAEPARASPDVLEQRVPPAGEARANDAIAAPTSSPSNGRPLKTVSVDDLAPAPPATSSSTDRLARRAAESTGAPLAGPRAVPSMSAPAPSRDAPGDDAVAATEVGATFDEELALVSAARSALKRGDARSCMRAVDDYRARFGAGTFAQEIEAIRIEALFRAGERARARAAAEQFLASNAASPYADRVRSLLDRTAQ